MTRGFEQEHEAVFARATKIFKDKSQTRGQMWMEFPPSDKIRELRERVQRIENAYAAMNQEAVNPRNSSIAPIIIEDVLDLINYANFLIKQIERGQRG
jgi:hypothetical protein